MTKNVYKTAQGKTLDMGSLVLQNEHVRAVGNMNVNARGDKLDSNNRVVETKARQIQKQNARLTNVSPDPVHSSVNKARKAKQKNESDVVTPAPDPVVEEPAPQVVSAPPPQNEVAGGTVPASGGLAAAIARSREIKQELKRLIK